MGKQQIKPKLIFKIKINGETWYIRYCVPSEFDKHYLGCIGITEYDHKSDTQRDITFRGSKVSRDTIAHELVHAYLSYYDLSKKTPNAMEEKICEILGKKYKHLYNLTNYIYNTIRRK